jgi:hypothetical protein
MENVVQIFLRSVVFKMWTPTRFLLGLNPTSAKANIYIFFSEPVFKKFTKDQKAEALISSDLLLYYYHLGRLFSNFHEFN